MLHVLSRGFVLRKVHNRLEGVDSFGLMARSPAQVGTTVLRTTLSFLSIAVLVLVALVAIVALHHGPTFLANAASLLGVMGITTTTNGKKSDTEAKKPANIRKMEADLKALAKELEEGQTEMAAGPITPERGEELEQKAQEMEELQDHIDRYNKIAKITGKARQAERVTLPSEREDVQTKSLYTTPGHIFVLSEEYKAFRNARAMSGMSNMVEVGSRLGRKTRLVGEAAQTFEKKAFDAATLSSLGTDAIIQIDRDPEIVRFEEPEILTIRDMLNTTPTTSDAIRYVKHTATTRAAASQATRGAAKGFLKVTFDKADTSVQTIAVLSKVTEQDVDDAPRLVGMINGEMTLDVRVEEERQLLWGTGASGELLGLFDPTNAVPEFARSDVGDTIIDTIRKMRTDLRKKRMLPNFVAIDPTDWETIELEKASTKQYLWGLITDMRGPRIWSLNVVESDAMTNLETGERRILMGDGVRGATIYDRMSIQLAVGFMDDDFGRNLRTLRAEERLALAVKRNFAFEFMTTEEASS